MSVEERVKEIIVEQLGVDAGQVKGNAKFVEAILALTRLIRSNS